MADNKKSFVLYRDQKHIFDELSDREAGRLIKFIFSYVNDESPHATDKIMKIAFEPIKQQLKRDLKDWESERSKRSVAGKIGGIKSGESRRSQSKRSNASKVEFASNGEKNDTQKDEAKRSKPLEIASLLPITSSSSTISEANRSSASKSEANEADNVIVTDNVIERDIQEDTSEKIFTIERCLEIALVDNRWVKANKVTTTELEDFNQMLEKTGVYQKNPMDYKSHFSRWKAKGKSQETVSKQKTTMVM